ncbi:MAG: hypothetical protein Q4E63_07950 [Prevotellaceae bacterium]|nr:hypothetical protein [Prevotellaceae bacterium]
MNSILFKFGMPLVCMVMLTGMVILFITFKVHIKIPVTMIQLDELCVVYCPKQDNHHCIGDTIQMEQTANGSFSVKIDSLVQEEVYSRLYVTPIHTAGITHVNCNTLLNGYIYCGTTSLYAKLARQLR